MTQTTPAPSEQIATTYAWQPTLAFLRYTVLTILAASAVFLFIIFTFLPDQIPRAMGPAMISLVALLSAALLRKGREQEAVLVLACGVWVSVTVISVLYGGIRATIYYVYPW